MLGEIIKQIFSFVKIVIYTMYYTSNIGLCYYLKMNNIKDQCIRFRTLDVKDIEIRTKWLQNPLIMKNLGWQIRKGTTYDDTKRWFDNYVKNEYDQRFIIEINKSPVGIVGLTDINPIDKNAMLYIIIGEDDYRGQGIGRKACEFIINYGFNNLKLHKINLEVNSYNNFAIRLYKSLGFVEEGCLKEQIYLDNTYHDEIYMGLINK